MNASIQSRTLRRAADILGGTQELCAYLQVPAVELARWLQEQDTPPAGIFLKAVDVIVDRSVPDAAAAGEAEPPERA